MDKLGKILKIVVNKKGLKKAAEASQICYLANCWGKGAFEAVSFSGSALKLSVKNHSQAQEVQMREEDLLDYLEEVIGRRQVLRIRWQVGARGDEEYEE